MGSLKFEFIYFNFNCQMKKITLPSHRFLTGTNPGMIGEYPRTEKSINTKGTTIYHFKDDLINGHTQFFVRITVMKQLGFI